MTQRQCKKILREEIQPVILGNSLRAHRLALRLYFQYGLCPILCAKKRHFLDFLNPFATVLPTEEEPPRLLCEQLCDLSARYEGYLTLLIPVSEENLRRIGENTEVLESAYVLASPKELDRWLAPCSRSSRKAVSP